MISYFLCDDKKKFKYIDRIVIYEYIFRGGVYYPFKTNAEGKLIYGKAKVSYGGLKQFQRGYV